MNLWDNRLNEKDLYPGAACDVLKILKSINKKTIIFWNSYIRNSLGKSDESNRSFSVFMRNRHICDNIYWDTAVSIFVSIEIAVHYVYTFRNIVFLKKHHGCDSHKYIPNNKRIKVSIWYLNKQILMICFVVHFVSILHQVSNKKSLCQSS